MNASLHHFRPCDRIDILVCLLMSESKAWALRAGGLVATGMSDLSEVVSPALSLS